MKARKIKTGTEGVTTNNAYFLVPKPANLPTGNAERTLMFWYRKDISTGVNAFFGYGQLLTRHLFEILADAQAGRTGLHLYTVQTFPVPTPRNVAQHIAYRLHIVDGVNYFSCFVDGHPIPDENGDLASRLQNGIMR